MAVETLTIWLFPIESGANIWRKGGENKSPPPAIHGRIKPFLVDRTEDTVDGSIYVRWGLIRRHMWKACHLEAQPEVEWNDLEPRFQRYGSNIAAKSLTESSSANDSIEPPSNEYHWVGVVGLCFRVFTFFPNSNASFSN